MAVWTKVESREAFERALKCARGCYQRNLLRGVENLSGSTLRGVARAYGAHYARSRARLLARMTAAGVPWSEVREKRGARILVLGKAAQ